MKELINTLVRWFLYVCCVIGLAAIVLYVLDLYINSPLRFAGLLIMIVTILAAIAKLKRLPRGCRVDENTVITAVGRDQYMYEEHDRTIMIDADIHVNPNRRVVSPASFGNWWHPYDNEPLTEEDRQRILSKLCKYWDDAGTPYEVL